MNQAPFETGVIHFVGIGGIGMSGIAEVMYNLGYEVRGSDISENANVLRLRELGIQIAIGHKSDHVEGAAAVVVSTAIQPNNAELTAAREARIPVVRRADMLAELMRLKWCVSVAGTHGKTTTTSMVGAVLEAAGYDPTVINGGIVNAYGTNAKVGDGDWMVVESDESDGSFLKLPATIAVITNIDPEHLDFYGSFDAEKDAFRSFAERVPFYGASVLCLDHPEVQALIPTIADRKVVTYGFSPQADIRAVDVKRGGTGAIFDVEVSDRVHGGPRRIEGLELPMPGRHNVQNATAAVAVANEMHIPDGFLHRAFESFTGVHRRFTRVGEVNGITIIDDYAHHPVEIAATLQAARETTDGQIVAVMQPHRYTRLRDLFGDFCTAFNDADHVIVAPVYTAGEAPIEGFDHEALAKGLKASGHKSVSLVSDEAEIAPIIRQIAGKGDIVIFLGAGSVTQWAHRLPGELAALSTEEAAS